MINIVNPQDVWTANYLNTDDYFNCFIVQLQSVQLLVLKLHHYNKFLKIAQASVLDCISRPHKVRLLLCRGV